MLVPALLVCENRLSLDQLSPYARGQDGISLKDHWVQYPTQVPCVGFIHLQPLGLQVGAQFLTRFCSLPGIRCVPGLLVPQVDILNSSDYLLCWVHFVSQTILGFNWRVLRANIRMSRLDPFLSLNVCMEKQLFCFILSQNKVTGNILCHGLQYPQDNPWAHMVYSYWGTVGKPPAQVASF